jgi:hypothetical protein
MTPRKIMALFIPEPALAAFIPLWLVFAWLMARALPRMPDQLLLPLLLAAGPIAALWWSVHRAAAALRPQQEREARNLARQHTGAR